MEHHVYFWFKDERKNDADRAAFEEGLRKLAQSRNLAAGTWGTSAPTPERPVTDHSWDYGISFKFATLADHDAYQGDDPHHNEFVASFKDWWAKVLVMDLEPR
ncbi:MAG: Dabb family protein [Akkermansiaceae bacterium]|nr:Dabb family protein [Akkermansiaceae bacterium]NNM29078.1 Dabb family protein [Akkermansiaceae bacterium]